jgi:hypothetical protein
VLREQDSILEISSGNADNGYSLLKKSFVELIFEENCQIFLSCDGISWQFDSETRYFALRKTQQFLFSTGWNVN